MARVPDEQIERLKQEVSVERLALARGIELRPHGKDLLGLCPFHDDRSPSLVITPSLNLWHCLGACQAGGSVIDWVMRAEGVSFRHAVELLREEAPALLGASPSERPSRQQGPVPKASTVRKLDAPLAAAADDAALLAEVVTFYGEALRESPEALGYMEKRGLRSAEAIERFRLGFANRTLGYRLQQKNRESGAELRGRLERLGVYRASGHEHLNGSVTVPLFDEGGAVVGMYGRKITTKLREGTPLHLYLPGPHRGVFNWEGVKGSEEVILCESLLDALTFWCAGFRHVTASYGVSGFTEDHRKLLTEGGTKRVLIAYDRDEAGDLASEKLSEELLLLGVETRRVIFPKGMDANEYAQKVGPPEQSLGLALRRAEWMRGGSRVKAASTSLESGATTHVEAPAPAERPAPFLAAELLAAPAVPGAPEVAELLATPGASAAEEVSAPLSGAPPSEQSAEGDEVVMQLGERRWRVRGLSKNTSPGILRVNLFVSRAAGDGTSGPSGAGGFHVDSLELYSARQRQAFIEVASRELGVEERVIKKDLGEVLLALEAEQERRMRALTEPKQKARTLTDAEQRAALELLRSPKCKRSRGSVEIRSSSAAWRRWAPTP